MKMQNSNTIANAIAIALTKAIITTINITIPFFRETKFVYLDCNCS